MLPFCMVIGQLEVSDRTNSLHGFFSASFQAETNMYKEAIDFCGRMKIP